MMIIVDRKPDNRISTSLADQSVLSNTHNKHLVNEFSNHAIPLAVLPDWCTILAVIDQFDDEVKLQQLGKLIEQINAETSEPRVPRVDEIRFVRIEHDIRIFLYKESVSTIQKDDSQRDNFLCSSLI